MSTQDVNTTSLSVEAEKNALYPMREVARITNINPITLRAWERRYDLITPIRTPSGHRLYSTTHIQQIQKAMILVNEEGVPISQVKKILDAEHEHNLPTLTEATDDTTPEALQNALIRAIQHIDQPNLNNLLERIFGDLPFSISANLLIQAYITLEDANDESHQVGKMLFNSLLEQRLQARLYYLQKKRDMNQKTLFIQSTTSKQPKWLNSLLAHFVGEQNFNVVLLEDWIPPHQLLKTLKTLKCNGICLVNPTLNKEDLSIWEEWLQKYVTLNNYLFGGENAKQYHESLGSCHIQELYNWFKPLK